MASLMILYRAIHKLRIRFPPRNLKRLKPKEDLINYYTTKPTVPLSLSMLYYYVITPSSPHHLSQLL